MTDKEIKDEAMRRVMWQVGNTNNDVTRYISDAVAEKVVRDDEHGGCGWIPVAERLPELGLINSVTGDYQEYICYIDLGDGVHDVRTLTYSSSGMWLRGRMDYHPDSVIAWMPLPEPYKP